MNIYEDTYFNIQKKGIFYMCTYFFRFVPFMYLKSNNHAIFAIILAIVWLNKLNCYYE